MHDSRPRMKFAGGLENNACSRRTDNPTVGPWMWMPLIFGGRFYTIPREWKRSHLWVPKLRRRCLEYLTVEQVGDRIRALVDRYQKKVQKIETGNRDLVTIIEGICADGTVLHPSVVFQGLRRDLKWGENNPCNAR